MKRSEFAALCRSEVVLLDGATGTNLQAAGLPAGVCPEVWIAEHPQALVDLQRAYVEAGTRILYAPTFTANRIKLGEFGFADRVEEINRRMVELSREAIAASGTSRTVYVAGDLTMTGRTLAPLGDLPFEELVEIYKEQVRVLADAGVDLFVVETMMSLQECRAAVLAIRETCDLPVMVTLTFQEDGRTLYGSLPDTCVVVLQGLGADAVGLNCSTGPEAMAPLLAQMRRVTRVPLIVKPNAGLPQLEGDRTVYPMGPEDFAREVTALADAGAQIVGGCCGTTPEHIAALYHALCAAEETSAPDTGMPRPAARCVIPEHHPRMLCSERMNVEITDDAPLCIIGERINPTGKKAFQAALREGDLSMVRTFAQQQEADGAKLLDVNLGTSGIDEKAMMLAAIEEVTSTVDLPLCIDTSFPEVMEAALRIYPGRALINSISAEQERMEAFLPITRKYGAMYIALPVADSGLPASLEEKHANLRYVLEHAGAAGLHHNDAVADLLVATVGADEAAAENCLETLDYCRDGLSVPTVCGLSNISFGMPQRGLLNAVFLSMAMARGLTMAIANPGQDTIRYMAASADLLRHRTGAMERFLSVLPGGNLALAVPAPGVSGAAVQSGNGAGGADGNAESAVGKAENVKGAAGVSAEIQSKGNGMPQGTAQNRPDASRPEHGAGRSEAFSCVLKGDKVGIKKAVDALLDAGTEPADIISEHLIPAIQEVGVLYNEKKYFLPQLIAGANAMETAMQKLEPLLLSGDREEKGRVVIATVQGDIHDIGKNLVALMLRNYGYQVHDLGKDVPAETIVDAAMAEDADIIALSALMTTTMLRMKEVVALARERGCRAKVIIGGAATTDQYAEEIGADGYSEDAASCVELVNGLLDGGVV